MASILEERIMSYLLDNAVNERILIKIDELAEILGEPRNPVYRALNKLSEKKKIKADNRGRMGMEISIVSQKKKEEVSESANSADVNNFDSPNYRSKEGMKEGVANPELTFQILQILPKLSLNDLKMIKQYVEMAISHKAGEDVK